jgi:hypothetical protein
MTSGERRWDGYPIHRNDRGTFSISTPLEYHKFTAGGPMLCGHQEGPEVLSPSVNAESRATWVGHLKCFPDLTPTNQAAKSQLLSTENPEWYWAVIQNPEGAHLARLIIVIDEECQIPCFPDTKCCETYEASKKPKQLDLPIFE